jgi:antitoxin component YwqK of YwqJK toxin-antitoxin module
VIRDVSKGSGNGEGDRGDVSQMKRAGQAGDPDPSERRLMHTALVFRENRAFYKDKPFSGTSVLMWENKRVNQTYHWVDGFQDGPYKEYTEESVLVAEETWRMGQKTGPFAYYYPNGAVQSRGHFVSGELAGDKQGWSRDWYANGSPEQLGYYVDDKPHGVVTSYYQDSVVSHENEYVHGVRHGHAYLYHKNGCPGEEAYYKNGLKDSISRNWEEINCKLLKEGYWSKGKRNGRFIQYGFFGDTLSLESYVDDVLEGPYMAWEDKQLETIGQYNNGKPDGFWKYGMSSNYQPREGAYDDGVMIGLWRHFDVDGYLLFTNLFDDKGELIKQKFYKRKLKYKLR